MASKAFELRNRGHKPHLRFLPLSYCWHAESKYACASGSTIQEAFTNWQKRDAAVKATQGKLTRRAKKWH